MTAQTRAVTLVQELDVKLSVVARGFATVEEWRAVAIDLATSAIREAADEATKEALEGAEQEALWCAEDAPKGALDHDAYMYVARRIRRLLDVDRSLKSSTKGGA